MWKRFLVVIIALVGTFSVIYTTNNNLFAATKYLSGGEIDGRINMVPAGLKEGGNPGLQVGDKVLLGPLNPENNSDLSWSIFGKEMVGNASLDGAVVNTKGNWVALATQSIGQGALLRETYPGSGIVDTSTYFKYTSNGREYGYQPYKNDGKNEVAKIMSDFNSKFSSQDVKCIANRDDTRIKIDRTRSIQTSEAFVTSNFNDLLSTDALANEYGKKAYLYELYELFKTQYFTPSEIFEGYSVYKPEKFLAFPEEYILRTSYSYPSGDIYNIAYRIATNGYLARYSANDGIIKHAIRPAITLNFNDVVFAVSNNTTSGLGTVTENKLNAGFTNLYAETQFFKEMKLRVHDSRMNVSLNALQNSSNNAITEIASGETLQINATANSVDNSVLSALLFKDGKFAYYLPLENVKATGTYAFDTSGIPIGDYQISIVNEVYNDASNEPANSSLLSKTLDLSIVKPLSSSYKPAPTNQSNYVYGSNVSGSTKVGEFSFKDGAELPTLTIVADTKEPGHSEDYKNFDIARNPTTSPVDLKIKADAPAIVNNSLKAGEYRFGIRAVDANANPSSGIIQEVILEVGAADTTLSFNDTAQQDLLVKADSSYSGSISTNNTDLISEGIKPTYKLTAVNNSNLLNVTVNDEKNFIVIANDNYTGSALPDTYTLEVSLPPTTNFKASSGTITKKFFVYKELNSLAFQPYKTDANYSAIDMTVAYPFGSLTAKDGSSALTYSLTSSADTSIYDDEKGKNNNLFQIVTNASGKPEILSKTKLAVGTYNVQFKVSDDRGKVLTESVVINVTRNAQTTLEFKNQVNGSKIDSLTLKYSQSSAKPKLIAEGGSGSGAITYALSSNQPAETANAEDIALVNADNGEITMKKIGKFNVTATKSGGNDYDNQSVTMLVTIVNGFQSIDFEANTPQKILLTERDFSIVANITRTDDSAPSGVTYTSTTPAICSVDASSGLVSLISAGSCSIKASNNDENYEAVEKVANIDIQDAITSEFKQIINPLTIDTIADIAVAKMNNTAGGDGVYTYHIDNATSLLNINETTGIITLKDTLKRSDLTSKWDVDENGYVLRETVKIADGSGQNIEKDILIRCVGEKLQASFENATDSIIHVPFNGVGRSFTLTVKDNLSGGRITYTITDNPSNLIDSTITQSGMVIQKRASENDNDYATIKAVIAPNEGYAGQELNVKVIIDKATQTVAFDAGVLSKLSFEKDKEFTISATSSPSGASITYEASPNTKCTINGNTITMVEEGICKVKAIASKENYKDAEVTKDIQFYQGLDGNFTLTHNSLEAKGNSDTSIGTDSISVGYMNISGGVSDTTTYSLSTNTGDKNAASSLFNVSENDGDVSLIHELKAEDLEQYATYDSTNHVYLLKIQIDAVNGSDTKTIDCEIKIKGAPLKNLSFIGATNNIITKTYTTNDVDKIFDLGVNGNEGSGPVTYSLKSGSDLSSDNITLSGTGKKKATIAHADDKYAVVIADITQSKGYAKTQAEVKVKINKADQVKFVLAGDQQNISLDLTGTANLNLPANDSGETLEFTSEPSDVVEVLEDGKTLHALKAGQATVSIKSPGNDNYNEKILTVNVSVYGALSGEIKQTDAQIYQADNTATRNKIVGTFTIKDGLSAKDAMTVGIAEGDSYFTLVDISSSESPGTHAIRLKNNVTASSIADCAYDAHDGVYLIPVKISVTDPALPEADQTVTIPSNIKIKGADMESDIDFTDAQDGVITKVYSPGDEFTLSLVDKSYIDQTTVTYRRKSDLADGVISIGRIGSNYIAYIEGASQDGGPKVYIEATIPSKKGYQGMAIETEVNVTKAEQAFDFVNPPTKLKVGKTETLAFTSAPKGNNGIVILASDSSNVTVLNGRTPKITAVAKGQNIKITATATGNENYNDKVVERSIEVYESAGLTFTQTTPYPQANSESSKANAPAGTFSAENGAGTVQIVLDDDANFANNAYFKITNAGTLSFREDITADILKNYPWNETEKAYEMQVKFKLTDESTNVTYATETVYVKGASLSNISFKDKEGNATDTITRNYADKQFMLELTGKVGNTWPYGEVTYSLEPVNSPNVDGKSTIIESIDSVTGITKILNANLAGSDEVANAKASIKAANGYDEQEVKAKIIINKADQPEFRFGSTNYSIELNGDGLNFILNGKLSNGQITYEIADESKVIYDADTDMFKPKALGSTIVTATTDTNDRNYNPAQAQTTIQVIEGSANILMIQIDQGSTVTYGDTGITASIKNSTIAGTVTGQKWSSTDTSVAEIDEATGAITIKNQGQTLIKLTQTIEGRDVAVQSQEVTLNVKRKILYVKIADAEKFVGEDMPEFTIESVTGLVGSDTFISPIFICIDGVGDIVTPYTGVGEYEIKGIFDEKVNPNYILKVDNGATSTVTNGILSVKQDGSDPSWYTVRSDASPTESGWYNKDVHFDLVQGHDYDKISDKIDGAYDVSIPIQEEGIHDKDVYFKDSVSNKIAAPQDATVKVDETKPKITSVAGKTINDNTFARVMNTLTLNSFFKPGSEITIKAQDIAPQTGVTTSGIAKIEYEVYSETPDAEGNTLIKEGSEASDQATFTVDDLGEYNICAVATDNAGNASTQSCQKATVSKIDVDVDGDGKPDFNDPDGDGCADLNIKWKDLDDPYKWIIINGDRNYDGIPDLNVDSDGNGRPDLNIDINNDGIPEVNLVQLTKNDWKPTICVITEVEEYCTGTNAKAKINIVKDNKQIPELNIDTNGDMKADMNIDVDDDGIPELNTSIVSEWQPGYKADLNQDGIYEYQTDETLKGINNIDNDGDNYPDVNIDMDLDTIPELNIDTDQDFRKPEIDIDGDGDGVKDINLDTDDDGKADEKIVSITTWKPDKNVSINGAIQYDTMLLEYKEKDELEDNGIVLKPSNPNFKFKPNYRLKVSNIMDTVSEEEKASLLEYVGDGEIKQMYDIMLMYDNVVIQPEQSIKVYLPEDKTIQNPKIFMKMEDTTYKRFETIVEDKFYVIETDYLGQVSIIGDKTVTGNKETPQPPQEKTEEGIGGVLSGDSHTIQANLWLMLTSISALGCIIIYQRKKENTNE